jgi:hypothetical protein
MTSTGEMLESVIRIPFLHEAQATMVMQCLEVDEELQPTRITKTFTIEDNQFVM